MTTTFLGALLGGVLTLFSPCSVMLLPAFFSYAFSSTGQLLGRTGVFYLGLITTLVPLGVLASTLGVLFQQHREQFIVGAAVVLVLLGVVMLINIPIPYITAPRANTSMNGTGVASVYLLGAVYGVAGMCAGPLLGAVLTASAMGADPLYGGILMLLFAAGMVVPLAVLAMFWDRFSWLKKLVRPREVSVGPWRNTITNIVSGVLLVAIGFAMWLTQGFQTISGLGGVDLSFTLENFVGRYAGVVPNWLVVVVAVSIVILVLIATRRKRRKNADNMPDRTGVTS